jgi:hypothetical protein
MLSLVRNLSEYLCLSHGLIHDENTDNKTPGKSHWAI